MELIKQTIQDEFEGLIEKLESKAERKFGDNELLGALVLHKNRIGAVSNLVNELELLNGRIARINSDEVSNVSYKTVQLIKVIKAGNKNTESEEKICTAVRKVFADETYKRTDETNSYQSIPLGPSGGGDSEFHSQDDKTPLVKGTDAPEVQMTSVQPVTDLGSNLIETRQLLQESIDNLEKAYALAVKTSKFSGPKEQMQLSVNMTTIIRRLKSVVQFIEGMSFQVGRE